MAVCMQPTPLPWSEHDVPHATVEVNQACNLMCHGCYKHKFNFQKSVEDIQGEIDFFVKKRNLETLTLLGGEPTLHPRICEIVAYVKSKGVRPHILTNATLLNKNLLVSLKQAGVARVTMHIDSHQGTRPDFEMHNASEVGLNDLRTKYANLCLEADVDTGFAVTLYKDTLAAFKDVIAHSQKLGVSKVFATTYCQEANIEKRAEDSLSLTNQDVFGYFAAEGQFPCWFVGSERDPKAHRWLIYTSAVSRVPGTENILRLHFNPQHRFAMWILPRLSRLADGHHRFEATPGVRERVLALVMMAFFSLFSARPSGFIRIFSFLVQALKNRDLFLHSIVIQELPRPQSDGTYDNCANCPDATVRNGKIIPVCYVDKVEPWSL